MKKIFILLLLLVSVFFPGFCGTQTGVFISLKDFETIADFSEHHIQTLNASRNFKNLFLKISNISPGKIEFSIVLNSNKGTNIAKNSEIIDFSQIGVGAELGKILNIINTDISGNRITIDIIWGISGMVYFHRRVSYPDPPLPEETEEKESLLYNFGFYSGLRLGVSLKKVMIHAGFQSIFPFYSNDIPWTGEMKLIKSYLYMGVTF